MKKAILSFGRFALPHLGHLKVFKTADLLAQTSNSDFVIYATHTQDKDNPLSYTDKLKYLKSSFPEYAKNLKPSKARTFFDVLNELKKKGYEQITLIVGGDRVRDFSKLIKNYVNTEDKDGLRFNTIKVVSAGDRDPDSVGISGLSSSKLRDIIQKGKFDKFKAMISPKLNIKDIKALYSTFAASLKEDNINNCNEVGPMENEIVKEILKKEKEKKEHEKHLKFREWFIKIISEEKEGKNEKNQYNRSKRRKQRKRG